MQIMRIDKIIIGFKGFLKDKDFIISLWLYSGIACNSTAQSKRIDEIIL
jgi:hypothetical protein